jgi:hypothetical protein
MKFANIAAITLLTAMVAGPVLAQPGNGPRYNWNKDNTPGWTLMTPQERSEHQAKMRAAKTYDECKAIQEEQHKTMEARAKEKGVTLHAPRRNGCDVMKAKGIIK